MLAVDDRTVEALAVDVRQRRIETRHGETHVLSREAQRTVTRTLRTFLDDAT